MNVQWIGAAALCPIVEFHDIRTEKFRSDKYLSLLEEQLTPSLLAARGFDLGHFRVENHPDRLLLLRGFTSMAERRRALTAFHGGADWARYRREATDLVRSTEIALTRAVRPAEGIR